jgi:hypothetical protein
MPACSAGDGSSVGWSHVRHWLWPLFTESWGAWRHHCLGLPAVPYSACNPDTSLPPPPQLLYGTCALAVLGGWMWRLPARREAACRKQPGLCICHRVMA